MPHEQSNTGSNPRKRRYSSRARRIRVEFRPELYRPLSVPSYCLQDHTLRGPGAQACDTDAPRPEGARTNMPLNDGDMCGTAQGMMWFVYGCAALVAISWLVARLFT